ncbi:hypothetical protein SAMN05421828_1486 [Acidiphilium rubrum]|uniref:Uncharacterized protein n=1 Tax=Acidiphilium rubrum TaxID=526 RepID=A0A8G2CP01_ACIRU|nr:hypothetical protein SAMN05421828_1486 [Acidiphilium rubrum]
MQAEDFRQKQVKMLWYSCNNPCINLPVDYPSL